MYNMSAIWEMESATREEARVGRRQQEVAWQEGWCHLEQNAKLTALRIEATPLLFMAIHDYP